MGKRQLVCAYCISIKKLLLNPKHQARLAYQTMARGDMTFQTSTSRKDEMGRLLRSLRQLGVNLRAGGTMDNMVSAVRRVTGLMSEIASATAEQNAGIAQVNVAVVQMDEVTQQNAALVEEATAAAFSLEEQTGNVVQALEVFKLASQGKADPVRSARVLSRQLVEAKPLPRIAMRA